MTREIYNKLIRDYIPNKLDTLGFTYSVTTIEDDNDYLDKLQSKLYEEVGEYVDATTSEDKLEELADVLEVVYAIARAERISKRALEDARKVKAAKNGSFKDRLLLEWMEE